MKPLSRMISVVLGGILLSASLLPASVRQSPAPAVKVIQGPEDVPDGFTSLARKGDFLVFDGRSYAVLGASARSIITSVNYPYGQAMGSLLGFVPADKVPEAGDLNLGAPVLRIGDKTHHLGYTEITRLKDQPGSGIALVRSQGCLRG